MTPLRRHMAQVINDFRAAAKGPDRIVSDREVLLSLLDIIAELVLLQPEDQRDIIIETIHMALTETADEYARSPRNGPLN